MCRSLDLDKCFQNDIWLQKSASIQTRTSPLKFDHLAEKSEEGLAPNLCPISEPNDQTLEGSFSSISRPKFVTKHTRF